jgi:two-component system, NtrC family, nitrogen regulation sensor histidine kinase NtrY
LLGAAWLVTISFIIDNYWADNSSAKAVQRKMSSYLHKQENDFDTLASNKRLVQNLAAKGYDEKRLKSFADKRYFFFVYDKDEIGLYRLLFWNTQVVQPDAQVLLQENKTGFQQLGNGYYVWRKLQQDNLTIIALIPVKWNYSITNEYLVNSFVTDNGLEANFTLSEIQNENVVKSKEGTFLFSLLQKSSSAVQGNNIVAAVFRMIALIILLIFIQVVAGNFVQQNFYKGVSFLVSALLLIRLLSYFFPVPVNLRQYELFDPQIYAATVVFRSLGDLLINAVFFLWIVLFIRHYMQEKSISVNVKAPPAKFGVVFLGILILLGAAFGCGNIIRSMVSDSQISFDVVNFFTMNIYTVVGFLVLGCLAIGFFLLSQIIVYLLQPLFPKSIMSLILIVTIVGLAFLSFRVNSPAVIFELNVLIWLLVYLLLLNTRRLYFFASKIVSSSLIFWLFFFSISIAIIIMVENNKKEIERRKHYADVLSSKADPASERLMNTVLTDFRSEAIAPLFSRLGDEHANKFIKDSLLNKNFTGYLNKYDTRIYSFDENERSLYNQDSSTFTTLNSILRTQGKATAVPDLYYYDVSYDKFNYISKKDITDSTGKPLGYLFIIATPKKYRTDALYPELFLKGYNASIENSPIYSFAVYNKLQMVNRHNDYAFPSHLQTNQLPREEYEQREKESYNELWYKAGPDKVVVIARKDSFIIESITLFSYLFCAFLFVTGFFWLLNSFIRSRLRWSSVRQYWQMSIRNQVHATIIFMSLLSFIVVGVATILFFIDRYYNNNRESLSRTIQVMQNEVRTSLADIAVFDDVVKLYDLAYREKLENTISKISEVHAVDINMYDLDGNLKVSSLPLPYNKGIVSNLMDPQAYYHLHILKEVQFFKDEKRPARIS